MERIMEEALFRFQNIAAAAKRFSVGVGDWFSFSDQLGFRVTKSISFTIPAHSELEVVLHGEWYLPVGEQTVPNPIAKHISNVRFNSSFDMLLTGEIKTYCDESLSRFRNKFENNQGELLVIKYIPSIRLNDVLQNGMLFAPNSSGYTWGDAVYVAPLDTPFSTMMYGEVGIVGRYRPETVFDGTDPRGVLLYQRWIQTQFRWFDLLTTTIHSDVANRFLRNRFRTMFGIDCVFFEPDQFAPRYVGRSDCWLAVSHWITDAGGRRVAGGPTSVIQDLELLVVVSERFHGSDSKFVYKPMLGSVLRRRGTKALPLHLPPSTSAPAAAYSVALRNAYLTRNGNVKPPVYVTHEQP
jgi:hypothetical protein